jgi:SMI1-KNR4 cell-wall
MVMNNNTKKSNRGSSGNRKSAKETEISREDSKLELLLDKMIKDGNLLESNACSNYDIKDFEEAFGINLPSDFRHFILTRGSISSWSDFAIFGLGNKVMSSQHLADITLSMQFEYQLPPFLLPIEDLSNGQFACLDFSNSAICSPVVRKIFLNPQHPVEILEILGDSFAAYLYQRLQELQKRSRKTVTNTIRTNALWVFQWHVNNFQKKFEYNHAKGGKLPRSHDWRPYRYCIQDVVFGMTVVRHERVHNCLEIDVFLTAHITEYDELAGAQALAVFLLSEAYKCGGTMELRFTDKVEGGFIPEELKRLAERYHVDVGDGDATSCSISALAAKTFYAALTGFNASVQEHLVEMDKSGVISMSRACYSVHHGIWTREQVEMIVLGSQRPDSVLTGSAQPYQRHLYQHDLLYARAALMGGILDRQLVLRERIDLNGAAYDLEDDSNEVKIAFDGKTFAKTYRLAEAVRVPWIFPEENIDLKANEAFNVLIRARDVADLLLHLNRDVDTAFDFQQSTGLQTFIVVPRDFFELPEMEVNTIIDKTKNKGIRLMVCPESAHALDREAVKKLATSRLIRK